MPIIRAGFEDNRRGITPLQRSMARDNSFGSERRRSNISRDIDALGTEHVLKGRSQLQGSGEATVEVNFPITFIEPPNFTFGAELAAGAGGVIPGQFPIVSAIVSTWTLFDPDRAEDQSGNGLVFGSTSIPLRRWYRGAEIACIITGRETQNAYIHWQFSGTAIANPVNSDISGGGAGNSTIDNLVL